eukprot:9434202-Heterocapsa_arctica.AAC.1
MKGSSRGSKSTRSSGRKAPVLRLLKSSASWLSSRGHHSSSSLAPRRSNWTASSIATQHRGNEVLMPLTTTFADTWLSVNPVTATVASA